MAKEMATTNTSSRLDWPTICLRTIAGLGIVHFFASLVTWATVYATAYRLDELRLFIAAHLLTGTLPAVRYSDSLR